MKKRRRVKSMAKATGQVPFARLEQAVTDLSASALERRRK